MLRRRRSPRPAVAMLALGLALAAVSPPAASGQTPILFQGARIRISWPDSPGWLYGVVEKPVSTDLQVAVENGREFTRIIIDDSTRLQLYAGRRSRSARAAVVGVALGTVMGGTVLSDPFGPDGSAFARTQGAFVGAVAGAGVGVLVSLVAFGRAQWEPVPIRNGRIVFPPLDPDDGPAGLDVADGLPWTRFPPREAAFAAFFEEYWASLDPIEGIFVRQDQASRFAIVRDRRFEGYRYVVVTLDPPATVRRPPVGTIVAAVRPTDTAGLFEMRFGDDGAAPPVRARLAGGELVVQERDGAVSRWTRRTRTGEGGPAAPTRDSESTQRGGVVTGRGAGPAS